MKRLFLCLSLVLINFGVADAAHERSVNQLIRKLDSSVPALQRAINRQSGIEAALSRVFVQSTEGFCRVRLEAGKQAQSIGPLVDPSDPSHGLNNATSAVQQMTAALQGLNDARESGDLQSIEFYMYQMAVGSDVAAFHLLQNSRANQNDPIVPGMGAVFEIDGGIAYMAGTIDSRIIRRLRSLPQVDTLVLLNVPGSADDTSNVTAIRSLQRRRVNTHISEGGSVESGGTDFLLAGMKRSVASNTFVGVHSWSGPAGSSGFALRNDRNHPNHERYLSLYQELGVPQSFYFFTLRFRPDDMHYMTAAELKQFGVVTGNSLTNDDDFETGEEDDIEDDDLIDPHGNFDLRLAGMWHERNDSRKTASIGFKKNGEFIVVNRAGQTKGQAMTDNGRLTLITESGNELELRYRVVGNTVQLPGRSVSWSRAKKKPRSSNQLTLSGRWIEVRSDGRPNKRISIDGNRFTERVNGRVTRGRVSLNGKTLRLDNEVFLVEMDGDALRFFDSSGRPVQRFHWEKS